MTCKYCIHFDVCKKDHRRHFPDEVITPACCKHFKDKNRFISPIFCKDCFYFEKDKNGKHYCSNSNGVGGDVADLDFCSYGERKDSQ